MIDYNKKKILEEKGFKFKYPPKEGYVVPLTDDRIFRIFCRDRKNRKFVAKLISLVTDIDYDLLVERMIVVDSTVPDNSVCNHLNEQDVIVTINNTTLNLEMSSNVYYNKRKNERTAFKYAGNQYKVGSSIEDETYIFYQICIENYDLFKNDYLINEVNMINVTSGNYEVETNEFKKFHVNLKKLKKVCYNSNEEVNKFFKFFTLEKEKDLEEISKGDEILMEAYKHLKDLSHDSVPMSKLEEQELNEYCQRLAIMDAKNEGEKSKQVEIAKKMLEDNVDISSISKYSGLSIDDIDKIKEPEK